MPDILHDFPIQAPHDRVFAAISTPQGLDTWWTKRSSGTPTQGAEYELWFGPEHDWRARVTRCVPGSEFELTMTHSDEDWNGSKVGFRLETRGNSTWTTFRHTGWRAANDHFRTSSFCWAMYLRVLRRNVEHGEVVPYERRLDV